MSRRRSAKRRQAQSSELLIAALFIAVGLPAVSISMLFDPVTVVILSGVILVIIGAGYLAYARSRRNAEHEEQLLKALDTAQIDQLSGIEFENYIGAIFKHQGYKVRETARSGDYGVDMIIAKDGVKTAVQIKRYKGKVNQDAVRQVVAGKAMKIYDAEMSMVVTNSYFTKLVYHLAAAHDCRLVDRDELAEWILDFQNNTGTI